MNIIPADATLCVLCQSHLETSNHLFLHCPFARIIWNWWLEVWDVNWVFPCLLYEAFDQWHIYGVSTFLKKVWGAIFPITMWSIWKERNSKIFRNTSCSHNQVQDLILTRLSWWIKGWGSSFPYSCNEIIRNPRSLSWCEARPFAVMLQPNPDAHWSPPPLDFIKWNVDASMNPTFPMSAIGGVLRNDRGQLMCVFSSPIPLIEINSAEIMAIYRAVQITMAYENLKNVKIMIESDSANAVRWCNEDLGDHGISISS